MHKIEKGIPLIETRGRPVIHNFADMKVGDSFFIEEDPDDKTRKARNPGAAAAAWGKDHGRRFTNHRVIENGVTGYRTHRVCVIHGDANCQICVED